MVYLQSIDNIRPIKHRPHSGMFNFVVIKHIFDARINNTMLVPEKWRQVTACDVAVFIDGGCQHCAAMIPIPLRIVRAASEKRNSERRSRNDHAGSITQDLATKTDR